MMNPPLYPKVVAGSDEKEGGQDALVLAERVVARDGGELSVVHVEKGSPADTFRALAEQGQADLVVLGSTHHAHVGSVSPGSVAEQLLHGARCRLLIAPRGYAAEDHSKDRLRVLAVGYDGMAESQAALDEGAKLALKFGGSMKVGGGMNPVPPMGAGGAAPGGGAGGGGGVNPPDPADGCGRGRPGRGGGGAGLPDPSQRGRRRAAAGGASPARAGEGESGPEAARGRRGRGGSAGPRISRIRP